MRYLGILVAVAAIAIGASACGSGDDQATAADVTTTSVDTGPAAEATGEAVGDGASGDISNQDVADQIIEWAGGSYAKLCASASTGPVAYNMVREIGIKKLGEQIVELGGDPAVVIDLMFADCR